MTTVDYDNKLVDIYDLVDRDQISFTVESGPIMHIVPASDEEDEDIVEAINSHPSLTAYKKAHIPDVWRYKNNRRVMPVFVVADEGWTISTNKDKTRTYPLKGNHGYDNRLMSMKAIFYAMGPNFQPNILVPSVRSIDIYPMLCELLGIPPAPNDGSLANMVSLLRPFTDGEETDD